MAEKHSSLSHFVCVGHEAKIINTACPGASPRTALGFPQEEPSPPFLPAPPVALTPSFWMGAHGDEVGIKGRGESAQAQGIVPLGLGDKTHGQVWWRSPPTMGPGEVQRGPPLRGRGLSSSLQEPWDSPSRGHAAGADSRPPVERHLLGRA